MQAWHMPQQTDSSYLQLEKILRRCWVLRKFLQTGTGSRHSSCDSQQEYRAVWDDLSNGQLPEGDRGIH